MGQSRCLVATALVAAIAKSYAQSVVTMGPEGECPVPMETLAYVYPAVYSQYFQTAGTIFNFMGGTNSLVIEGPTTIISTTMVTSVPGTNGTGTQTNGDNLASTTSRRSRSRTASTLTSAATSNTRSTTTRSGAAEPTETADCPDSNGEVVDGYFIACSIGSNGNNIDGGGLPAASFEICLDRCNATANCVAVSHQNDIENGPCYLYDRFDSFNTDPQFSNYDIAVLFSVYDPDTSPIDGGSGSSTTASRPASSGATTTSGRIEPTSSSNGATTTLAGTTTTSGPTTTPVSDAICPDADAGEEYEDYYIYCSSGMNGNTDTLPNTGQPAATFADCIQRCTDTDGCLGVSYPNDVSGGNCYLYSTYEEPGLNPDYPSFDIAIKQEAYNAGPTDPLSPGGDGGQCDICQNPDNNRDETERKGYYINCASGASGTSMSDNADNGKLLSSLCECIDLCDTHKADGCVSVSHVRLTALTTLGECYMMSDFTGFDANFLQFDSAILNSTYNDYIASNVP